VTSSQPPVTGLAHETSLARIQARKPDDDFILGHTQPEPPPGCQPPGCLHVNAKGAPALRDPELRLPPLSCSFGLFGLSSLSGRIQTTRQTRQTE